MKQFCQSLAIIPLLGIILAYAGLVPIQQWHMDEYRTFLLFQQDSFAYFLQRLTWSPRPVSELLLFCYFFAVKHLHAPLITAMLGLCWLTLIGALSIGLLRAMPDIPQRSQILFPRLVIVLGVFSLFLVSEPPAEVFFWTQGAVAYLITLAAITALLFYEITALTSYRIIVPFLLLVISAGSSEMGAMFAASYAGLQLVQLCWRRKAPLSHYIYYSAAFVIAAFLLMEVIHGRVGKTEFLAPTHARFQWDISIHLGAHHFLHDLIHLLDLDFLSTNYVIFTLITTGLIWVAIALLLPAAGYKATHSLYSFTGAVLLTNLGSFIASEYEFGGACCPRHEALRQALILLGIIAVAVQMSRFLRFPWLNGFASLLLVLPVAALFLLHVPNLIHDWLGYDDFIGARTRTWESGMDTTKRSMVFVNPPKALVSEALYLIPGTYSLQGKTEFSDDAINARVIMQLFGKETLEAIAPTP